jgi:hypothetical protein
MRSFRPKPPIEINLCCASIFQFYLVHVRRLSKPLRRPLVREEAVFAGEAFRQRQNTVREIHGLLIHEQLLEGKGYHLDLNERKQRVERSPQEKGARRRCNRLPSIAASAAIRSYSLSFPLLYFFSACGGEKSGRLALV